MIGSLVFQRAQRAIAFGRHMPIRKIARRLKLSVSRALRDRWPAPDSSRDRTIGRAKLAPQPVFAAREGSFAEHGFALRATFLNRSVDFARTHIPWHDAGDTSADQLWRMNLHYMDYLEAASDALFAELVDAWIAGNPQTRAKAWRDSWNSYALSLRVVVWMQQLAHRAGRLSKGLVARAEASLCEQLAYLERNLETDLGGNHLVKNIKALIWASAYFEGDAARRWRKLGVTLLAAELPVQVLPDGVHYERSPAYHCQVLADLLECRHALGHDPLEGRLDAALALMAQALADLTHPDGLIAQFNDAGLHMAYAPAECVAAYARLAGTSPAPRATFELASAGYYGLGADDSYLVIDCGRIAPDDLPAHGHGDVLAFEWSVAGQRIIVDQGVFEYVAGPKRGCSRSAASHNTLSLAGADQADFYGAFRCGRRPNVRVIEHRADTNAGTLVLEGTHDGFAHLPGAPAHVRRFEARPHQMIITDRIEGATDRPARVTFLLHPNVEVALKSDRAVLKAQGRAIVMTASQPMAIEDAVWWPDMGVEIATRRVCIDLPVGVRNVATTLEMETT